MNNNIHEQNKNLHDEYIEMIHDDIPDLWDRISSSLPEKKVENNSPLNTSIIESSERADEPSETETGLISDSKSDIHEHGSGKKVRKFPVRRLTGILAACICLAIALPIGIRSLNHSNASLSDTQSFSLEEVPEASMEEDILYEAEDSYENIEPYEESSDLQDTDSAAEASAESAENDEIRLADADQDAEAYPEAGSLSQANTNAKDSSALTDGAEADEALLYNVSLRILDMSTASDKTITCTALLTEDCPSAGLQKGDRITLVSDSLTPDETINTLTDTEETQLNLEAFTDENGNISYLIR